MFDMQKDWCNQRNRDKDVVKKRKENYRYTYNTHSSYQDQYLQLSNDNSMGP